MNLDINLTTQQIKNANSILLTTHKRCDGDGLSACLALYHALKKINKKVRIITVDIPSEKYSFLGTKKYLESFDQKHQKIEGIDLAVILDTNDKRIVEPLFNELEKKAKYIIFVDHHPLLRKANPLPHGSFINSQAGSTGEIVYEIIKRLGIRLDTNIARALYTSIAFDTQIFRYIKNSSASYAICVDLLEHEKNPEEIHNHLFTNGSVKKIPFLSQALNKTEIFANGTLALIRINQDDLAKHELSFENSYDLIDILMGVKQIQCVILFQELSKNKKFKISMRSKGSLEVLSIAEALNGGGHLYAAGVTLIDKYENIRQSILDLVLPQLEQTNSKDEAS